MKNIYSAMQAYKEAMENDERLVRREIDYVIDRITADNYWAYNFALRYHQNKRFSKRQIKNLQVGMLSTCLASDASKAIQNLTWYNMFQKHIS